MSKNKWLAIGIMALTAIAACKKDDTDSDPTPVSTPNYGQLKVGNYWVYERYRVEPNGTETPLGIIDSSYVFGDTLINNKKYYKYVMPGYPTAADSLMILRDSSGWIVDPSGYVAFAYNNFTTIIDDYYVLNLPDTVAHVTTQMADKDLSVTVPAGTFVTTSRKKSFVINPPYNSAGSNREMNSRYAAGTGLISETLQFYQASPDYTERKLIRYHLE